MTYCLAIIPADSVDCVERAGDLARRMRFAAAGEPPAAVAEVLDDLRLRCTGEYTVERRDENGVILATRGRDRHVYETLLWMTKDRDLVVYDLHAGRLYDPRVRVDVEVSVGERLTLPYLTRGLLCDLVLRPLWPDPQRPFFIVARGETDFIQVYRRDDGIYQLEHREGGPESHVGIDTRDSDLVIAVMWAWTVDGPGWRTALDWRPALA